MQWVRNFSLHLFILAASAGLWPLMLTGQNNTKKLLFTHISIEDGLSQGMITDIIQDRYGFMWLGTKDGLNQYDGYRFSVYRHSPDDLSSLSDSYTTALMEDSLGRIWVGTVSGRVDLFDRNSGSFKHVIRQGNFLTSGPVRNLIEAGNGNIIVLIGKTIIEINGKTLEKKEIPRIQSDPDYFALGSNSQLYCMQGTTMFIRSLADGKTESVLFGEQYLKKLRPGSSKQVTHVIESPSTKQYIAFFHGGIISINTASKNVEDVFPYDLGFTNQACFDSIGDLWISADTRMVKFNLKERSFTEIRLKNNEANSPLIVSRFYRDRGGIYWFGTTG
ncbi:MAG TPA: two-component regulator propeller domain-containing protein, partial [Chitinophagaceae bacterium]|nr:two-component regulator propeller domain-containing protein [Chitinophagaceae bacterium]